MALRRCLAVVAFLTTLARGPAASACVGAGAGGCGARAAERPAQRGAPAAPGVLLMQVRRDFGKSEGDAGGEAVDTPVDSGMSKGKVKSTPTTAAPSTTTSSSAAGKGMSKGASPATTAAPSTTSTALPEDEEPGNGNPASGTGAADLMVELERTQGMIAKLQERVASMTSCCGCNSTEEGGSGGDKSGRGFNRPTTTRLNGPVSAGGAPTTTTTTTSTEVVGPPSLCAIFGDPHFITFDGGHTVLVGDMVIWLVKTPSVWIQALSKGSDGKFSGFAIGGAFMRGHKLIVYNNTMTGQLQAVFDGRPILNETVDEFHVPDILDAHRDDEWDVQHYNDKILNMRTEAKFDVGDWHERFLGRPQGGLFVLSLPDGVEVTTTGVDFMSAVITMPRKAPGTSQGGYCGNFNGDPEDDAQPIVPSWNKPIGEDLEPVEASLDLFRGKGSPLLLAQEAAELAGRHREPSGGEGSDLRSLLDVVAACPEGLRSEASERCSRVEDARMQRDCVFDVCLTKDLRAADGALAAEAMEEELNAKGIPIFMGHGLCADAEGRPFEAWATSLRTESECQDVLRTLALTKGVLGAQLRRTASCQVVVEPGTDPTGVMIPGGWGKKVATSARGKGLVRGVARDAADGGDDASWSCWQLD